eukprot:7829881-Pyramimonas_sp.AAC.1
MGPLRGATGPRRTVRGTQIATAGPRRARTWDHNGRDSWVPGCRERGAWEHCRKFQRKASVQ